MKKHLQSVPGVVSLFRENFFAGVLILAPIAVVIWLLLKVFAGLWAFHALLPEDWKPGSHFDPFIANLLNFGITIVFGVLFVFFVSIFGWISKQYIGLKLLDVFSHMIERIPVVRSVYSSLSQLLQTIGSGDKKQFSRVVYLEYPRKGTYALAFVTGPAEPVEKNSSKKWINLYVPTTPNPTSGFHLIVPEDEVRDSGLSVEEAFKVILSLGIAHKDHEK